VHSTAVQSCIVTTLATSQPTNASGTEIPTRLADTVASNTVAATLQRCRPTAAQASRSADRALQEQLIATGANSGKSGSR
jgi:hypothetical protein